MPWIFFSFILLLSACLVPLSAFAATGVIVSGESSHNPLLLSPPANLPSIVLDTIIVQNADGITVFPLSNPFQTDKPTAKISISGSYVVNQSIQFSAAESTDPNGKIKSYEWNFGDDSPTSGDAVVSHVYQKTGPFTLRLTVVDDEGLSDTDEKEITIVQTPPPTPFDRDKDGIPDSSDKCPDAAENYNGYEDGDGCPDQPPKPQTPDNPAPNKVPDQQSGSNGQPSTSGSPLEWFYIVVGLAGIGSLIVGILQYRKKHP